MSVLVEGCVESLADAQAAARGGADRLELCADLSVGGTTPAEATESLTDEQPGGTPSTCVIKPASALVGSMSPIEISSM